ncbi:flavin monoamine oxidase family protein [Streptomyces flavofungini]|uniref:FAD-dependent oxidoreductase n=1 Tax=Streptomyces flavofungini TaxID=68200 RepID=A0ABS0XBF3_9ACTN|nr:FAD-dependent oxidoreductase [Streptomyces flavofungini]MBJ3810553.1 FAD-dependent oxidoreductase [Streptomyces flavofungini]GHC83987.1 monoamine oxidase [Streptomyces flavofungini]
MPDAIVVGAGYAGLCAARRLRTAGLDVVVLEAGDRVGGRTCTARLSGGWAVDLGGQWIAPAHTRFTELARSYDAATFTGHAQGDHLLLSTTSRRRFTGELPPLPPHATAVLALALWKLDRLASRTLTTTQAQHLDSITVATWLRCRLPVPQARRLAEAVLGAELSVDVASVSMLALITAIRSADGVGGGVAAETTAALFTHGADGPAQSIAAELGDAVRLNTPVTSIQDTGNAVRVADVQAARVIVTIPPPLAGRIHYDPPMPAARDQLTQRMPMGAALKAFAVYDTPFWRAQGLSGQALDLDGPMTFDASRPGGPGLLCTLATGPAARRLTRLDAPERRATIIRSLIRAYGPRAARPLDWREKNWADDPYCRGGYNAYFPPGVLTSVGSALRTPVGRIHWAGSETATQWAGYIEGAIRSGERAADEVLRTEAKFTEPAVPS